MGLEIEVINKAKISEPQKMIVSDYLNYHEMLSYVGYFNLIKKVDLVLAPSSELSLFIGNCEFCNVDYVFNYLLGQTSMKTKLSESIFAGGKGLTLYKAIASALGEAFERLIACFDYFNQLDGLIYGTYQELSAQGYYLMHPNKFKLFSEDQLKDGNFLFDDFKENTPVGWLKMKEIRTEKDILLPACLISMYYQAQTKEEGRIGYATSGGLTSHFSENFGKTHGLTEIIERHEINLSWYDKIAPKKIILDDLEDPVLKSLRDYIDNKGISFYLHNVDQHNFFAVTAMSFDKDVTKYSFNTGGGISEDIEDAVLEALVEYAQSVNNTRKITYAPEWLTSKFSNSVLDVNIDDDPKNFKTFYQAVSYYGLKENQSKLDWYVKNNDEINLLEIKKSAPKMSIEDYINKFNLNPVYMDLKQADQFKYIFISKVYMTEFSPAFIGGVPALGHPSFKKYLKTGTQVNDSILPFP